MNEKDPKLYLYVCPNCFNVLKECTCDMYPWTLIQIDKKIHPIIKELNRKCFYTEMCCEGHIGTNEFIYIEFKGKYKIKPLPNGFEGDGSYIRGEIKGKSIESKKNNKRRLLKELYDWAIHLEPRGTNFFME